MSRNLVFLFLASALTTLPVSAGKVKYYHVDALGNVRVVTDQAGNVVERHDYLPFGEECTTGPCATNPGLGAGEARKFTGKERDTETGLDYFGARYYAQKVGRFTTIDPVYTWNDNLLDPQRWNRYAYVRNNPLRYVDPDGREIRTTEIARIRDIAGPAGARISIAAGRVDVSALRPSDLVGNEGATLIHEMATSKSVYGYQEGGSVQTAGGLRSDVASGSGAALNLDNGADWRIPNKGPGDRPPTGFDSMVGLDPSVSFTNPAGNLGVSVGSRAFHELAEAYAKVDNGQPYVQRGGGPGAHADAVSRERTLIQQRPGFTQFPAGQTIKRQP